MHYGSMELNLFLFITFLLVKSSSPNECYRKYLWRNFQDAAGKFDNPFYAAASSDLVEKNSHRSTGSKMATLVVSPLWLEFLLVVISLGANGKTLCEINDGTYFVETQEDKMEMLEYYKENIANIANPHMNLEIIHLIFLNTGLQLKDSYRDFATSKFNMTVDHIDFTNITESRIAVNKKVNQRTRRKMTDVFEDKDLKPNTSIVLVSSIYFKNRWLYSPTILNGTYDFKSNSSGHAFKVRMFRLNGMMPFANLPECDAKVIEVPYITEGLSMLVFLPNTLEGLEAMEKELLNHGDILNYYKSIMIEKPVTISLPIYAAEMNVLLPSKLKKMNIKRIFNTNAELGGLVEDENVSISNAVQRIKFWADAGRGAFKDTGEIELPIPEEIIFADHPFFFIVKMHETSFLMGHFIL